MDATPNYRVGNLVYTKRGLLSLFLWLIWFDFCFQLMEMVIPPVLQFRLKNDLKADAFLFTLFMSILPAIINFILAPIISIKSDRHRGPRGRRIPFLLYGAPVACISLVFLAFGNEIAAWIQTMFLPGHSVDSVTVWTFGSLFLVFTVSNVFLGTTFYFLFNDVVPESHFIKFTAYMRAAYTLAQMVFSWFIYGYLTYWGPLNINLRFFEFHATNFWYPKLILIGTAIFYMVAATLALLNIKEPEYPPPPPLGEGEGFWARTGNTMRTLFMECFSHRFYVIYFITCVAMWMSFQMGIFMNPMRKDVGMDLMLLGKIGAGTGFIGLILALLTAKYGSRYRPLPLMIFALSLQVATSLIAWLFLMPGRSPMFYMGVEVGRSLLNLPVLVLFSVADSALPMSLLPRDRYGQFCAAKSMLRMILGQFIGGLLAGWLMRTLENHFGSYALRFAFVWSTLFQALALGCYLVLYREWQRLGGKESFRPPPVGQSFDNSDQPNNKAHVEATGG